MRSITPGLLALALGLAGPPAADAQHTARPLFDGATFAGWDGPRDPFRIQDEAIVAGTLDGPIAANAFLCTTEAYDDFALRLRVRLAGPGDNAGIQFRSRRVPDHHEVSGYQADVGTVGRDWFYRVIGVDDPTPDANAPAPIWGALYDETRRNRYLAWALPDEVAAVLRPGAWNEISVQAVGPHIQIWLNGVQTVDYTEPDPGIEPSGVICLQIHSGPPAEAWYKDITLQVLEP